MDSDQIAIAMMTGLITLAALYFIARKRSGTGGTVEFIIYSLIEEGGDEGNGLHKVLRWGEAPADQVASQAGFNEAAIAAPTGWISPSPDHPYVPMYKLPEQTLVWLSIGASPPTLEDNRGVYIPLIRTALRETEWAVLPDAPLSPSEVAEMVTYREDLRVLAASITEGTITISIPAPPYQEI